MGNTVIMASHILDEVEKICSHVAIIKNGQMLATGPIGAILSNDTTVELNSSNRESLLSALEQNDHIKSIIEKKNWVECLISEDLAIDQFSESLYKGGITPTRLVARKRRLEEEFLEITSNQN